MINKFSRAVSTVLFFGSVLFLLASCNFENLINTLSKTGVNVFTGNSSIDKNVGAAVQIIDTVIGDFDENLADVAENVSDAVDEYDQHKDLAKATGDILGTVRIDTETYLNILSEVSKASLTEEGTKKFAESILSSTVTLNKSKEAVTQALTGMKECLNKGNDALASDYKEMAYDIIDSLIEKNEGAEYSVPYSDVLIVSLLATAACDAVQALKNSEESGVSLETAILNDSDLISEVLGVVQVATVISKGAALLGKEPSRVVSAVAGINSIIDKILK